ncbi:hypothetical protein K502DRAFT_365847 [Neoconidiobolus thromboides FSU 785]|nr:hypothetical protein K502DRAFT_365847 [Neoconidiobolus thromboides FSU 785]
MKLNTSTILLSSTLLSSVLSHSWMDCIGDGNQKYTGPNQYFSDDFHEFCIGFGRGYPGRMNRWINDIYTVLVENRGGANPADYNVCKKTQVSQNYTSEFPMTKTKPGAKLKIWYELDNHYTKNPTYVYLWGYGQPGKDISKYSEQVESNLIMKHVFALPDNQNCMDIHNANSLCWFYWTVPETYTNGIYSFIWNWRWDQNPTGEEYNTCFDIEIQGGDDKKPEQSTSTYSTSSVNVPTSASSTSEQTSASSTSEQTSVYSTSEETQVTTPTPVYEIQPEYPIQEHNYFKPKPAKLVQGGSKEPTKKKCHQKY